MTQVRPNRDNRQRDQLLVEHLSLVTPIAHHYAQLSPEPLEDLLQVGLMGLLRAAEGYDPTTEVPFDSYARPHIRGGILHHLRDRAWLVRLPRRQSERQWSQRASAEVRPQNSQTDPDQALQRWHAMARPLSLEALEAQGPGQGERLGMPTTDPVAAATESDSPYAPLRLGASWESCSVKDLLALVGPRQRRVLQHVVLDGWSYRRTAAALKVSAPTVQRLLHRSLAELQARLSSDRAPSAVRGC